MPYHQGPEHQQCCEQEGEREERSEMCRCPVCGGMHHIPWGPMKRKHMLKHWGGMGPWGGPPMGMLMMPMMGLVCMGPALMALAAGFVLGRKSHHWRSCRW